MEGLLPTPGNSGRGGDSFASDLVEVCGSGLTFVVPFGFDLRAHFPFLLPLAAAFALYLGGEAVP